MTHLPLFTTPIVQPIIAMFAVKKIGNSFSTKSWSFATYMKDVYQSSIHALFLNMHGVKKGQFCVASHIQLENFGDSHLGPIS